MSEYAEIKIGKLSLCWFRNYLDKDIVRLFFSKNDLVVIPNENVDDCDEEEGTYNKNLYKTTVQCAKERLDSYGFSLSNMEKIFNDKMTQAVDYSSFLYHLFGDYDEEDKRNQIRIKKNVSFRKWKNAMKKIISYELANGNIQFSGTLNDIGITTEYFVLKSLHFDNKLFIVGLNRNTALLFSEFSYTFNRFANESEAK